MCASSWAGEPYGATGHPGSEAGEGQLLIDRSRNNAFSNAAAYQIQVGSGRGFVPYWLVYFRVDIWQSGDLSRKGWFRLLESGFP